jgi:hypothetical protein
MLYFQTKGAKKAEATGIMDIMIPKVRSVKGCLDCKFLIHEEDNRYALLVYWESKELAEAAAVILGPDMLPPLNKIAMEPVKPVLFEVYQQ